VRAILSSQRVLTVVCDTSFDAEVLARSFDPPGIVQRRMVGPWSEVKPTLRVAVAEEPVPASSAEPGAHDDGVETGEEGSPLSPAPGADGGQPSS
jgi:hypothetical protein